MKIAFNPSTVAALITPPNNKDITFDLRGRNIFARGVKFCGTDTWRDIKINNVSIGSNILDLRNGSNTTLTNTNGVVTINSTWRPVVDNLTSDSTTSSLSAKQGKILKSLIDGKSNSDHNHDGRYLRLNGSDTMQGNLNLCSIGTSYIGRGSGDKSGADFTEANIVIRSWWGISFKSYDDIVRTYIDTRTGNIGTKGVLNAVGAVIQGRVYNDGDDEGIIIKPSSNGYAGLILGAHNSERSIFYLTKGNPFWRYNNGSTNLDIQHPKKPGVIALTSDIPSSLKNPYSLTTFGVVYDGSAAKVVSPSNFISQVNEAASTVTDGTMFITSYTSNSGFADTNAVNVPYKRKAIHLWEYIKAKTDSLYATRGHNHDDRYLKLTGGTMSGTIYRNSGGTTISGRDHAIIRQTYAPGGSSWNPIACVDTETGTWTLGHLSSGDSDTNFHFCFSTNADYNAGNNNGNYVTLRNKVGTIALLSEIPSSLKNPHALTISLNGTSQGPYDGSAAKNINITPSSIGAATSGHNHDGRYVYNYGGTTANGQTLNQNALFMSTTSGITGDWWHILQAAWNDEYRWNSQIAFPTQNRNGVYYRSGLDDNTKWGSWVKLLDVNNYSSTLDSRYYTESEVNSLLDAKLNRQNLSYGTWNPRGYNLAADYSYNGGDLSISESGGKIHISVDGYFWQNEGQYRVLDTSDVAELKNNLTVHQYLSNTDTTWWPLIWGGSSHNNTSDSTGKVYKSYDKLSWQTSSQTLYATHLRTTDLNTQTALFHPDNDSTLKIYSGRTQDAVSDGHIGLQTSIDNTDGQTHAYPTQHGSRCVLALQPRGGSVYIGNMPNGGNGRKLNVNGDIGLFNVGSIRDLTIGGGIYWNPYVESASDGSDSASITVVRQGVAGGTTLVLSQMNDANDTIQFKTNGSARLYHNSYPILTTQNTYVSNNKGYINGTEITQVNNASNATNSINSNRLSSNSEFALGNNFLQYFNTAGLGSSGVNNAAPDKDWWHIIRMNHPNSKGYFSELAIALNSYNGVYWRTINAGREAKSWTRLANIEDLAWNNIAGKPSSYIPSAHTHTVFNNNLMIKGTNGISNSASIHLGIGDSDTGFKWISDGKCQIYANNVAVGEWTSGGMNWFKNPAVNGNKVWNAGNDGSGSGLDADTVDSYHASAFVKIKQFRFRQYNQGTWTKILTITINSTADLQPVIAFSWIPSECSRTIWADFSINWRSNSPIFYAIWKGMNSRTLKVVNSSGAIWDVWVSGNKTDWDPFGEIQVTYTHNITSYNGGNLGYSDVDPGGTICITGGQVNYANSAGSATKVIVNQHTTNDTNYPLVWSNQNNSNTVTENQLFKSWSDLYYNPKNKRLTVGGSIYAAHFYESSDKTLKKNIKSILSSTNIPKIREFDWKDTEEHSYGFIAQELEEQGYGCLVSEANGKKTVNYTATLALTVAKLQNLINIQNKKISNLTKELKALKYGRKKNS